MLTPRFHSSAVIRDQGYFAVGLHLLLKVFDINLISYLLSLFGHMSGEYKKLISERKTKQQ